MNHKIIGLGSNLGNKRANLSRALCMLEERGVHSVRNSSLYETEPIECSTPNFFLNQVCVIETILSPRDCLQVCKTVEQELGRTHSYRNAPRIIDIDILFWMDMHINDAGITIPHPRLYERKFVILPLCEVVPEFSVSESCRNMIMLQVCSKLGEIP